MALIGGTRAALVAFVAVVCARGQSYVGFDAATASSTFAGGDFAASSALRPGSGYWCSAGKHASGQTVTWTGLLNTEHKALGVKINWSYAPGSFKILTSSDGSNFEETACWRVPAQGDVAHAETIMFEGPRTVRALTVVMQSARSWNYFGIDSAALLVQPYSAMLVSGLPSAGGEACVVARSGGLSSEPCLDAIAAGDGREVFTLTAEGQLRSAASGQCVGVAGGDLSGGGQLATLDCHSAEDAGDGRAVWSQTPQGQLLSGLGEVCLQLAVGGISLGDCQEQQGSLSWVAVPEFKADLAHGVVDSAALLVASVQRQKKLLAQLQQATEVLGSCSIAAQLLTNATRAELLASGGRAGRGRGRAAVAGAGDVPRAIARVYPALGVDVEAARGVLQASVEALALVRKKVTAVA